MQHRSMYLLHASPINKTEAPYVIGFQSRALYRYVSRVVGAQPKYTLRRSEYDNIAIDVNVSLQRDYNVQKKYDKITVDTGALITFAKDLSAPSMNEHSLRRILDGENNDDHHVTDAGAINFSDLLYYPFDHYVGVIMPYQISDDTRRDITIMANVIDPVADVDNFRKRLQQNKNNN